MPDSFLLPDEIKDLEQHMRHFPNQTFICKPSRGRGGEGISLIKKYHDLPRNATHCEYLVQRYVENPLLVHNKKFDIRLYIVIKGVDPIEAYLFEEGLARFCTVSPLRASPPWPFPRLRRAQCRPRRGRPPARRGWEGRVAACRE